MAHFHPLAWHIELPEHDAAELDSNPIAQSRFVHEYVHYVQTLTGTIGRHILLEMVRLTVFAAIQRKYGWPPPKGYDQVHAIEILKAADRTQFAGTEPQIQFQTFMKELTFTLDDTAREAPSVGPFLRAELAVGAFKVNDFVHVVVKHQSKDMMIPVTDRVVFENMARQVQRNYLRFNNELKTDHVDDLRKTSHGDLTYICLHDHLASLLPKEEDPAKWTIGLCQLALLCRNPGAAFEHMAARLVGRRDADLSSFLAAMDRDSWFKGEFDVPPVQESLEELVGKWGSTMLPRENWELRELTKCVANATNALRQNYSFFASPLLTWSHVGHWLAAFGCPPIQCRDQQRTELHGIRASMPWHAYLERAFALLQ